MSAEAEKEAPVCPRCGQTAEEGQSVCACGNPFPAKAEARPNAADAAGKIGEADDASQSPPADAEEVEFADEEGEDELEEEEEEKEREAGPAFDRHAALFEKLPPGPQEEISFPEQRRALEEGEESEEEEPPGRRAPAGALTWLLIAATIIIILAILYFIVA